MITVLRTRGGENVMPGARVLLVTRGRGRGRGDQSEAGLGETDQSEARPGVTQITLEIRQRCWCPLLGLAMSCERWVEDVRPAPGL